MLPDDIRRAYPLGLPSGWPTRANHECLLTAGQWVSLIVAAGRAGKRTGWGAYFSDGNGQLPALGARYDGNLLRLDNGCQAAGHHQQQAAEMSDKPPSSPATPTNSPAVAYLRAIALHNRRLLSLIWVASQLALWFMC